MANEGGSGAAAQRGRAIYKLGTHKVKVKDEQGRTSYADIPILSRALRRIGTLLQLDEATRQDIETTVQFEGGNATYYKRGATAADRILIVYEESGDNGEVKVKQIRVPVPNWAPNYKLVDYLANKAKAAGLKLRGIKRHGYLIVPPSDSGGGGGGSGGSG